MTDLMGPYRLLAEAVLTQAFSDAKAQITAYEECRIALGKWPEIHYARIDARRFLCGDSYMLHFWCQFLNIHPDHLRAKAKREGWCSSEARESEEGLVHGENG